MFKTLLASTFLLFNVNTCNAIKPNQNNANGFYQLYGSYCLREYFDNGNYDADIRHDYYYIFQSLNVNTDYNLKMNFYGNDNYIYNTYVRNFMISYVRDDYVFNLYLSDSEYVINEDIDVINDSIDVLSNDVQELVLFFATPLNVSADAYIMFNNLFTSQGNEFVTSYSGWYTLTHTNYQGNFNINGFFTVDNNLYNQLYYSGYDMYVYLNNGYHSQGDTSVTYQKVNNKVVQGSSTILFDNVLVPNYMRTSMQQIGSFSYVYEPVQYTFGDMIFSVVDAPVYMLSQLFSFELFGIQFYVAFMGIVTVVLICFVLKKII